MAKSALKAKFAVMVGTNAAWAERAITALFKWQTESEQSAEQTTEHNGVGFNGTDAEILSSFAKQITASKRKAGERLSPKQLVIAFKKLPKYAGQLVAAAYTQNPEKAAALEAEAMAEMVERVAEKTDEAIVADVLPVCENHPDVVMSNSFGAHEAETELLAESAKWEWKNAHETMEIA